MEQFKPPLSLSSEGNVAENWPLWFEKFQLFLTVTGIEEKSEKVKCATFRQVAEDDATKVFHTG